MLLWLRPLVRQLPASELKVQVDRRCARDPQPRGAAAARSEARMPMRARASITATQASPARHVDVALAGGVGGCAAVTVAAQNRHKSTAGGMGDRPGDAGLIRGLHRAGHDRAPRPPALDVATRASQPRCHRDEKSRDPDFSRHAPNSRRGRLTESSTGVQVWGVNYVWFSRYRDFGRPRLEFVLDLY